MELADLFEKIDIIERHKRRGTKNIRKQKAHRIENPEDLSPEAFRYYTKESTGVAQHITVRLTNNKTFVYVSHSRFK